MAHLERPKGSPVRGVGFGSSILFLNPRLYILDTAASQYCGAVYVHTLKRDGLLELVYQLPEETAVDYTIVALQSVHAQGSGQVVLQLELIHKYTGVRRGISITFTSTNKGSLIYIRA
jgi:hypothetical protein